MDPWAHGSMGPWALGAQPMDAHWAEKLQGPGTRAGTAAFGPAGIHGPMDPWTHGPMGPWAHGPWYQVLSTKYQVLSTKYQVLSTKEIQEINESYPILSYTIL